MGRGEGGGRGMASARYAYQCLPPPPPGRNSPSAALIQNIQSISCIKSRAKN